MKHPLLYVIVFVSGAAVLAIEILGTRILGPFYGVTLFLWSALITVTLVALAVGYAVGGRLADRSADVGTLGKLVGAAGVWILLIPWLKRPLLLLGEPVGLRIAVLTAALLLCAPPLALLGMVGPIAVRVKATRLGDVGRSTGDLLAVSTAGSVAAALLVGFVLIPSVGVRLLTLMVGVSLLVMALVALGARRLGRVGPAIAIVVVTLALAASRGDDADHARGILAVEQSPYGEIRVLDYGDGSRHLLIDGGVHSSVMIGSWQPLQAYIWVSDIAKQFFNAPGRLLLIGLGAGSTAGSFARDGWHVDAVEIDPVVTRLARSHFGLAIAEEHVVHDDGRALLRAHGEDYDVIDLDAFSSNSIPAHLFTTEAFALIESRLSEDGVVVVNIEALGTSSPVVGAVAATLAEHFRHVICLPVGEDSTALTNLILFASDRPLELRRPIVDGTPEGQQRLLAWSRRFAPDVRGAPVLTDDLSPVDVWSEQINAVSRRTLHAGLAKDGLRAVNW